MKKCKKCGEIVNCEKWRKRHFGCGGLLLEVASAAQPPKAGLHQRRVSSARERRATQKLTPRSLARRESGLAAIRRELMATYKKADKSFKTAVLKKDKYAQAFYDGIYRCAYTYALIAQKLAASAAPSGQRARRANKDSAT